MRSRLHGIVVAVLGLLVFGFSWLFRFNDPGGAFAGLTDDHFFYVVRGWQILYGDLPVRDFVDHGAPLYYYVAAAVQRVFGRGTLSELAFSVTALSIGAALTFRLAARASGWLTLGLAGALVHILLEPRFYNYPKVLVYAVGIPLLWRFAERPGAGSCLALAAWTVISFLLRHDHGVFLAAAVAALLVSLRTVPWRERFRHATAYAALSALLAAPYLIFIQTNGGLARYVRDAADWAAKDRRRAPVVWPGLFENPGGLQGNAVAWLYYLELLLPFVALAVMAISREAFRPGWVGAVPKMVAVAVLAMILNAGFLRSPLEARLADPSVPHAILLAWLGAALTALLRSADGLRPGIQRYVVPIRVAVCAVLAPVLFVLGTALLPDFGRRLEKASLAERPGKPFERSRGIARQLREDWQLVHLANQADRSDLVNLALYLNACTKPDDRIFVQPYIPQVLGLARRAFAGGHADLRPGFFTSPEAQVVTLERLGRQSVPVALLEMDDEYVNFRKSFPAIAAYLDREYAPAGSRVFDARFGVQLLARKDLIPTRRDRLLDWPCFR